MPPQHRNGRFEIRLNDDGSQAFANIYPPVGKDGEAVEYNDVIAKLKQMGITYGYRDQAIRDALRQAGVKCEIAANVIVAQGVMPQNGQDAKVRYTLPMERLAEPVPKRRDGSNLIDWFALNPANLVTAEQELAILVPAQPGTPGRTLAAPVQDIPPRPGRPAASSAGQNVRFSDDGLRMFAMQDGYACLHGEQMMVHAFRQVLETALNETRTFPAGAVFFGDVVNTQAQAGGFIAARGAAGGCFFRAKGDILLHSAEDCRIVATGNVYVVESLRNCDVTAYGKIIALDGASLCAGALRGRLGVEAGFLGSEEMIETRIEAGINSYAKYRIQEIQEEMTDCEANIARITQAIKPFITLAAKSSLTDEKRALLSRLQAQQRSQDLCIKDLHNERRQMTIAAKERIAARVMARDTVHPGVWVRIGNAETLVESPLDGACFHEAANGKAITMEALQAAA